MTSIKFPITLKGEEREYLEEYAAAKGLSLSRAIGLLIREQKKRDLESQGRDF